MPKCVGVSKNIVVLLFTMGQQDVKCFFLSTTFSNKDACSSVRLTCIDHLQMAESVQKCGACEYSEFCIVTTCKNLFETNTVDRIWIGHQRYYSFSNKYIENISISNFIGRIFSLKSLFFVQIIPCKKC